MPSKRDIREKAMLSLFALTSQSEEVELDEELTRLCLEPEGVKITKLSYKALKHQVSSLQKWTTDFQASSLLVVPLLKTYDYKGEARTLLSLVKQALLLAESYSYLSGESPQEELEAFYTLGGKVHREFKVFRGEFEGLSVTDSVIPVFKKALTQLVELSGRIECIAKPTLHGDKKALSALIKATSERDELEEESLALAKGALAELEAIDPLIEENLEHFSKDQLGKVERTLLRLAIFEILHLGLPKPVVINETLELSKKYATPDAAPLLNGVLDKLGPAREDPLDS